jgi:hypothetical protein
LGAYFSFLGISFLRISFFGISFLGNVFYLASWGTFENFLFWKCIFPRHRGQVSWSLLGGWLLVAYTESRPDEKRVRDLLWACL